MRLQQQSHPFENTSKWRKKTLSILLMLLWLPPSKTLYRCKLRTHTKHCYTYSLYSIWCSIGNISKGEFTSEYTQSWLLLIAVILRVYFLTRLNYVYMFTAIFFQYTRIPNFWHVYMYAGHMFVLGILFLFFFGKTIRSHYFLVHLKTQNFFLLRIMAVRNVCNMVVERKCIVLET